MIQTAWPLFPLLVVVGIPKFGPPASFSMPPFIMGEQRVMGSFMGSTRLRVDIPHLVKLYQNRRYKLDELISNRYPLEDINEAITSTKTGNVLRNVIVF
jgi:S-(hydroxymethyl)glutathione dehydrogenase/alcohol dehydrogenase